MVIRFPIAKADANHDGQLSKEEFYSADEKSFTTKDKKADGTLTLSEYAP